jgi:hypothetical protein
MSQVRFNVHEFREYLPSAIFEHLYNCFHSAENKEYFSSAVWGAVFTESFLAYLIEKYNMPKRGADDLNGSIQTVMSFGKDSNSPFQIQSEYIRRFQEIRQIRNRLVHDTGLEKKSLLEDSQLILAGIRIIMDWYKKLMETEKMKQVSEEANSKEERLRVFISTIRPHEFRQVHFLEIFYKKLRDIGIEPVIGYNAMTQFDKRNPLGKISSVIEKCDGVIVMGLERSHAYFLREKEGAEGELEATHRKYTSGWLHIEAGIAYMLGKPTVVACQKDLHNEGIFDREWNQYDVFTLDVYQEKSNELDELFDYLEVWAKELSNKKE